MKKIIQFNLEEYDKIRELLEEIRDDIWDIPDSMSRSVLMNDLGQLKELLGISEV